MSVEVDLRVTVPPNHAPGSSMVTDGAALSTSTSATTAEVRT